MRLLIAEQGGELDYHVLPPYRDNLFSVALAGQTQAKAYATAKR